MRVKVLNTFADHEKKCLYTIGQTIEISNDEVEKYNSASLGLLVEVISEDIKNEVDVEEQINYNELTKKKLVEIANEKGISLDIKMSKAEMIKELI